MPGFDDSPSGTRRARHGGVRPVRARRSRRAPSSTPSGRSTSRRDSVSARPASPNGCSETRGASVARATSPDSGSNGWSTTRAPARRRGWPTPCTCSRWRTPAWVTRIRGTASAEAALGCGAAVWFADRARPGVVRARAVDRRRRRIGGGRAPATGGRGGPGGGQSLGRRRSRSREVLSLEARDGSSRAALARFADVIDMWFRGGDWANQWLSLRHVFGILVQLDDNAAAATLHGALTAIGAAYALPFEASDAERIDVLVDELRDEMRPAEFATAVRRGASMTRQRDRRLRAGPHSRADRRRGVIRRRPPCRRGV